MHITSSHWPHDFLSSASLRIYRLFIMPGGFCCNGVLTLQEHPEWRDKVLLVQIAVPSRTDVPEYQKLR